jgi:hypothetical protein
MAYLIVLTFYKYKKLLLDLKKLKYVYTSVFDRTFWQFDAILLDFLLT